MVGLLVVAILQLSVVVSTSVSRSRGRRWIRQLAVVEGGGLPPAMVHSKRQVAWRSLELLVAVQLAPLFPATLLLLALLLVL